MSYFTQWWSRGASACASSPIVVSSEREPGQKNQIQGTAARAGPECCLALPPLSSVSYRYHSLS